MKERIHVVVDLLTLGLLLLTAVTAYEHRTRHSIGPNNIECAPSCVCLVVDRHLQLVQVVCRDRELDGLRLPSGTVSINFTNVTTDRLQDLDSINRDVVMEIIYRSSGIHHLGLKVFEGMQNLTKLDLGDNRLENIPASVLSNLINLKILNLTGNTLHHFSPELFQNLTLLKELHLSYNHLHVSKPMMFFSYLKSLQVLDLSYNQITSIIDSFPNKNLLNLTLSHNAIRDIHTHSFADLSYLTSLDLSYNALQVLPDHLFKNNYKLEYLDLTGNSIKSLPEMIFQSLKKLKWLGLNDNQLYQIPDRTFASNMELEILHLSRNNIEKLNSKQLIGLYSLKELNIKDNHLTDIDSPSKKLESIDLSNNKLTRPPKFLVTDNLSLRSVRLKNNPWLCDCSMQWFSDWSSLHQDILDDSQSCDSLSDLPCLPPTSNRSEGIQLIEMRSNATIDCQIVGNPPPSITWVTPMGLVLHYTVPESQIFTDHPPIHQQDMSTTDVDDRVKIISHGVLYIKYVLRTDAGLYTCFASNRLANLTTHITIHLDRDTFYNFKLTSIIIGISCAAGFLLMTFIGHLVVFIFKK